MFSAVVRATFLQIVYLLVYMHVFASLYRAIDASQALFADERRLICLLKCGIFEYISPLRLQSTCIVLCATGKRNIASW